MLFSYLIPFDRQKRKRRVLKDFITKLARPIHRSSVEVVLYIHKKMVGKTNSFWYVRNLLTSLPKSHLLIYCLSSNLYRVGAQRKGQQWQLIYIYHRFDLIFWIAVRYQTSLDRVDRFFSFNTYPPAVTDLISLSVNMESLCSTKPQVGTAFVKMYGKISCSFATLNRAAHLKDFISK